MVADRNDPQALDYSTPSVRRRIRRGMIVVVVGAVTALLGIGFFACAHNLAAPGAQYGVVAEHVRLHELLWAALGLALLLAGALIAAVGLQAWCRNEAG